MNKYITFFIVIAALLVGTMTISRSATAAPSESVTVGEYALATKQQQFSQPDEPVNQEPPTPDYMATKVSLENQAAALQLTMIVDSATSTAQAVATEAQEKKDKEQRDEQIKIDTANRQREKELLELEALRNRMEWERWFVPFWEWFKLIGAVLLALLTYAAIQYLIPVIAARLAPQSAVVTSQGPTRSAATDVDQPAERAPMRFVLTRNAGRTYQRGDFPEELLEPMLALARHVGKGGQFSEDELIGSGKIFKSRTQLYVKLLEFLLEYELLEQVKNPDGSVKYYYITHEMKDYLKQYLAQYREETGDLS